MSTIHIIEDDQDLLAVVRYHLLTKGFGVFDDYNGNFLGEGGDSQSDLYLVDINLDNRNGMDLCGEIKKKYKKPVIMMSANEHLASMTNICGADTYIRKPFQFDELIEQISRFI